MNEGVYYSLLQEAASVATLYSNPQREHNYTKEEFSVEKAVVLSDHAAVIVFEKSSGLRAVAHFIYIPAKKRWTYYFPTDSHLNNLNRLPEIKYEVEQYNADVRRGMTKDNGIE